MCNEFSNWITRTDYAELLKRIGLHLTEVTSNLEPRDGIFPKQNAPVLRPNAGGMRSDELRFGLVPWFHKGQIKDFKLMTTNDRCEMVGATSTFKQSFAKRRCIVPFDAFFEWSGEKGSKRTKYRFDSNGYPWLGFAGIWIMLKLRTGW